MPAKNAAQKLIEQHLVHGKMVKGEEIAIKIDQTLCQDATGTMVMLELEAMGVKQAKTEVSAQYVDHNLVQNDFKNADDHVFLQSAAKRFGLWYSRPGNGVSHPVHMEHFGKPGKTLLGSDSHTCAAGSMGMLAIGAGGLEVALAIAGEPFYTNMPSIFGVKITGKLSDWVSAKDVILEMLRRHSVKGGVNKIIEYYGDGLKTLSAMDRHVIANMGAELGATATVFPSDERTKEFLEAHGRGEDWIALAADPGATYDEHDEINLCKLVPLIACPTSPDHVMAVADAAKEHKDYRKIGAGKMMKGPFPVFQTMVGSSANPGLRDFAIVAMILDGKRVHDRVSLDINPSSRQVLENLTVLGYLEKLIRAGGRLHQAGCNGCIGMGQAPAYDKISLRTVPRNFPERSGTNDDKVYLCSPEVAAAAAITGVITDPRTLGINYPQWKEPKRMILNKDELIAPNKEWIGKEPLAMGTNIQPIPVFPPLQKRISGPVILKMEDNISTDTISPAGSRVLPFRSNIPKLAEFCFEQLDQTFSTRILEHKESGFIVIARENYGQGSSREHAALAPRYLGLQAVFAVSYARIHRKNLINFGIAPLLFDNIADYDAITQEDILTLPTIGDDVASGKEKIEVIKTSAKDGSTSKFYAKLLLSPKEREELLAGGLMNVMKARNAAK